MGSFNGRIERAIDFIEGWRDTPDTGMVNATPPGQPSGYMPPNDQEPKRIDADLMELFSIKASVEPAHGEFPSKELRQRLWDVEDYYSLHPVDELRP